MGDEVKKVGILNVQWVDNYGAVLLAYALQLTIDAMGYQAEIIDYRPVTVTKSKSLIKRVRDNYEQFGLKGIADKVIQKVFGKPRGNVNTSSEEKHRRFEAFRERYLKRTRPYHAISSDDFDYNIYVVGSDVVWKPDRVLSCESEVYFLNFTADKPCVRVTYAASIGTDDEEKLTAIAGKMGEMIQKFDSISVREKASIPFVQKLSGKEVQWCIDPTLLLTKQEYDKLLNSSVSGEFRTTRYIYFYCFENNTEAAELVNRYSREMKLPVICQCGIPEKIENLIEYSQHDGPVEFIQRIRDADFVITDSFHGTVFSIIYGKSFITLSRGNISIRMKDLLSRLELMDRYVADPSSNDLCLSRIDYSRTEQIIDAWRKESMIYLENALSQCVWGGV